MQTQTERLRWGDGRREDNAAKGRARILAAAVACYQRQGVAATTVEDVAREAQISRRTVYYYFSSRQHIIQGVVEQQAGVFLEDLNRFTQRHAGSFRDLQVESMLFAIEQGPRTVRQKVLMEGNSAMNAAQHYLSDIVLGQWQAILTPRFATAQAAGEIPATVNLSDLVEWMGRLVLSWIQFPAPKAKVREQLRMLLPGT